MSGILEQEFDNIRKYASKGRQIEAVKQEDGTFTAQKVRMGATGLDLEPPIQTPLQTGEPQTKEQTAKEIGPSLAGVATGPAVGAAEVVDLGLGLVKGAYKAAFPDADEGRFESFMQTLGDQFESGYGEGARSMILDIGRRAGYDEEQLKVMDEGMTAGSFFGYGGAVKAAPKVASALGDAVEGAGDAAKARMADTDGSVTLTSGVDPDPAIAALGDAVKAARAKYEASPNDPNARREYLDARHERDAQLSSMPVKEKLETDVSYRMAHQPTAPQDGAARLDDMTGGGTVFPDNVYSDNAVRFYGGGQESVNIIQAVRGNPEAEVTIYRAVPKDVDTINPGDWVTLSKSYADDHAESGYGQMGDEAGKVISQKVKVKDVYSDGNDLNEFGYFPEDIAKTNIAKLEPPTETEPGIIAFHGSGKDFDEFSLKYIGTGEGAQAYGYGLYFTDNEDIAKFYKETVIYNQRMRGNKLAIDYQGKPFEDLGDTAAAEVAPPSYFAISSIAEEMAKYLPANPKLAEPELAKERLLKRLDVEIEKYSKAGQNDAEIGSVTLEDGGTLEQLLLDDAQTRKQALLDINSEDIKPAEGKMYKVGLAPKPDELLDYDLPLSQQPKKYKAALDEIAEIYSIPVVNQFGESASFGSFQDALNQKVGPVNAMKEFNDAGIPGIKYFDNASRNTADGKLIDVTEAEDGFRAKVAVDNRPGGLGGSGRIVTTSPPYKTRQEALDWADEATKKSGRNYVIFDDKMIKILEKYGIVGPVAITGVAATQQEGESDGTGA